MRDCRVAGPRRRRACGSIGAMPRRDTPKVRRARWLSRIVGAIAGAVFGVLYGAFIISNSQGLLNEDRSVALVALIAPGLAGSASLALAAPLLSGEPFLCLGAA